MIEEVRRVSEIQDHAVRARSSVDLMRDLQAAVVETARMRRESVAWLRDHGHSLADVAKIMGVSRARAAQLKDAGPPPERIFLGSDRIQVAVPQRPGERDYVALEDSATGQKLLALAHRLQLDGDMEYIPTTGSIDLNRESLVVVCGPKTSPVTGAALRTDPRISFETLDDGRWALIERESSLVHTSPMDDAANPESSDVAYFGRLRRPDGLGDFLLIAGVHSVGSLGVAHYLADSLSELYDKVGTQRFSMVVGCNYDPSTKSVSGSRAVTEPFLHEVS